ncbi:hypothetical protein F511_18905 [Dorcoceras hygrometricum]|uniref:Uncharacterized protein n=1 Tax=Dorcoceras hygrometricum TaxID=472368 RepID=A0A2Z7CAE6_9LAMI|nr:hypothetical protein F511_18905 [Dorcoceras hygrometricum]
MLELYEQNRVPPAQASEAEGSAGGAQRPPSKGPPNEEHGTNSHGGATTKAVSSKPAQSRSVPDQPPPDDSGITRTPEMQNNDHGRSQKGSVSDRKRDYEINDTEKHELEATPRALNTEDVQNKTRFVSEGHGKHDQEGNSGRIETRDAVEPNEKYHGRKLSNKDGAVVQSPQDARKKIEEKVKAALERRKARGDIAHTTDQMDELERELEDIEVPGESEKIKHERKKQSWSKPSGKPDHDNSQPAKFPYEARDGHYQSTKGQSSQGGEFDPVEEGEVESFDDDRSPRTGIRKRKANSPLEKPHEGKQLTDHVSGSHKQNHQDYSEDRNGVRRLDYSERGNKRHAQENHV